MLTQNRLSKKERWQQDLLSLFRRICFSSFPVYEIHEYWSHPAIWFKSNSTRQTWRCKEHYPLKKVNAFAIKEEKKILGKTLNKSFYLSFLDDLFWVNNSMMEHNILKSSQPPYWQPFARIIHILKYVFCKKLLWPVAHFFHQN